MCDSLKHLSILCLLLVAPLVLLAEDRPNIIVFLVDDMGLMDTSVPFLANDDGDPVAHPLNEFYRTPAMERLAAKGIRFSDFYAHSVCSPTRASILSGQNAARHTTTNWINPSGKNTNNFGPPDWNWQGLAAEDVTLPRILQGDGYKTIFIGKAHFGPLDSEGADPLNLGFDVNIGGAPWGRPKSYYGRDHYGNHPKYTKNNKRLTHNVPHLEKYYDDDVFLTEALTIEAKAAIDTAVAADQPFYLQLSHYAAHSPFQSDPRFAAHYSDSGKPKNAQAYATLIEGMDKSLGDVMDHLEAIEIAENTLIFFLGDNGGDAPLGGADEIACSAPLRGKKGSKWEGGVRVPFIAAWAATNTNQSWQRKLPIPTGAMNTEMGVCYDLMPTILDLVGAPVPPEHRIDGQNLNLRLMGQVDPSYRDTFLSHFPHTHRSNHFTSYRMNDWKVIYNYRPDRGVPEYQLYHLSEDASESNNLAESHPEKLQGMMQAMTQEMHSMGALRPEKDGEVIQVLMP